MAEDDQQTAENGQQTAEDDQQTAEDDQQTAENRYLLEHGRNAESVKPPEQVQLDKLVQYMDDFAKGRKLKFKQYWRSEWQMQYEEDEVFWKKENLSLEVKIDELKNKNAALQIKYEESLKKNEALKVQFKEQLAAKEYEIAALCKEHETENKRLLKLYSTEAKTFEAFRNNVVTKDEHVFKLQNEVKNYKQAILEKTKKLEASLAQKEAEVKKIKMDITQQSVIYEIKLQTEKSASKKAKLAKEKVDENIQILKTDISKSREKHKDFKAKISELETKVQDEKKKLKDTKILNKRNIEEIYQIVENRNRRIDDLRIKAEARDKVLAKLQMKNKELQGTITCLGQEITGLKREREKLFKEIENEKSKSGTLKVSLNEREEMNRKLEAELEEEKEKHDKHKKKVQSKTLELQLLSEKHNTLKASHRGIKPEVNKCHRRIKQLENKIISMQCDIQSCVDVFHYPKKFLPFFVRLKERHLDNSAVMEADSHFSEFHRYIRKLTRTFEGTIASQKRDRDNLSKMLYKLERTPVELARANLATEKYSKLEDEKRELELKLRNAEKELHALKFPPKSKVDCWLNKFVKRSNKVHPAADCSQGEELPPARPPPAFETPQKVSAEPAKAEEDSHEAVSDSRCLPTPETSSPTPIPDFINHLTDDI
ncbi:myosin heavy chain, non-muscle-like [Poecilia latipinna]|uniref:myosin heavy chain, non-muscle-like n=1 Tax=Poecilia latipinna TaxID=48699 RepID=UPI00072DFDB9|nr:PREDICTED: myosin heavy chain, non-muscle-like [Poecilia latipinna]